MQSEYAKSDREKIDLRTRRPKSSDFGPQSDDLGHQNFKSKNGVVSKLKMLSTTATSSRTTNELDGDTAGWRRCVAPDAQSAGDASLYSQTSVGWRGLSLDTKRSALGAHLSVVTYSWTTAAAVSRIVSHTKYQDRLTRPHSARRFAARPEAFSVDSDAWILRAGQRFSASLRDARPQRQLGSAFAQISARTIHLFFSQRKSVLICQVPI